jgi:hypothetical protein
MGVVACMILARKKTPSTAEDVGACNGEFLGHTGAEITNKAAPNPKLAFPA